MRRLGFVGFGALGQFLGEGFSGDFEVGFFDPHVQSLSYKRYQSLADLVMASDIIIVATPASAFENVISEISDLDIAGKLVVDVLSTKTFASDIYLKYLPNNSNILSLHTLFGPPSYKKFEPGLRVVSSYSHGQMAKNFEQVLADKYSFTIIKKTPKQHDKHMAYHHALPFILAHALAKTDFNKDAGDMTIPSEEKLRKIVDIAGKESIDLYLTIMRSNPYAQRAVDDLLETLLAEQKNLWP